MFGLLNKTRAVVSSIVNEEKRGFTPRSEPTILECLSPADDKQANAERRAMLEASLVDCLPAEKPSLTKQLAAIMPREGRRIDLMALLSQRSKDGNFRWTVANPGFPVWEGNGCRTRQGVVRIQTIDRSRDYQAEALGLYFGCQSISVEIQSDGQRDRNMVPQGFPAIPASVREIYRNRKSHKDTDIIAVLYQPDAWELKPEPVDPALVIRYVGNPQWYCLAVWGHDGPNIMEFVD